MKIKQKPSGIWYLDYLNPNSGKRERVSLGTRNFKLAESKAQRIVLGVTDEKSSWTLEDALRDTERRIWSKQRDRTKAAKVNKLCRLIGGWKLREITKQKLQVWVDSMGVTPATCNRYLAMIRKAMNEAQEQGHISTVPKMPLKRENNIKERYVSPEEETALITGLLKMKATEEDRRGLRNLIVFLLDTGGRITESLKAFDYYRRSPIENSLVIFQGSWTKSGKTRSVPLTTRAEAALSEGLPESWEADGCSHRFRKLCARVEIEGVTLHTLRHTCASRLVQAGMDLYKVRDWLGHSSIQVTERYAHLAPDSLREGADILEQVARGKPDLRAVP